MAKTDNKVRSMPWAVKLLLTVLIGGLFPITVLIIPPDAFPIPIPDEHVGAVCIAVVLITTFAVPTVRRSGISTSVFGRVWTCRVDGTTADDLKVAECQRENMKCCLCLGPSSSC
jgi:hypothetical protein